MSAKKTILFALFILFVVPFSLAWGEGDPILHFPAKKGPETETIERMLGHYKEYVLGNVKEGLPDQVLLEKNIDPKESVDPLYTSSDASKYPYSLGNFKFVEALLANGYKMQAYFWLIGEKEDPIRGSVCTLTGYYSSRKYFTGVLENGKKMVLPYDYAASGLQFAMILKSTPDTYIWTFQPKDDPEASFHLKAEDLSKALKQLEKTVNVPKVKEFNVSLFADRELPRALKSLKLPFTIELKKRKSPSAGCAGFTWFPAACNSWDYIPWKSEWGQFYKYDAPCHSYPNVYSKNYVHNQYWQCLPCVQSYKVMGIDLMSYGAGAGIEVKAARWSTCNIANDAYHDEYGNATAYVKGTINVFVIPPSRNEDIRKVEGIAVVKGKEPCQVFTVTLPPGCEGSDMELLSYTLVRKSPNILWQEMQCTKYDPSTRTAHVVCRVYTENQQEEWEMEVNGSFAPTNLQKVDSHWNLSEQESAKYWSGAQPHGPVQFTGGKYDSYCDTIVRIYVTDPKITGCHLMNVTFAPPPEGYSSNIKEGTVYCISNNPAYVNTALGFADFMVRCKVTRDSATPWWANGMFTYRTYTPDSK